ncbi:aTPase AAA family [Bacteroides sp. CAG:530]|nr:aTPase AAA family [Bacteroides sp. CAG:530]
MKNLYLRAKCILNDHSNNNAPEYEENSINVEVTFPQAITADELSIRIYNNDSYKEMCVGYHYNKSYKKFKKVCLNISSSEDWENQHLKAYVIIDNEVKWQCSLFLHEPKDNYWTKQILSPIDENSVEKFFVEKLSITGWWDYQTTTKLNISNKKDLIEKLFTLSQMVHGKSELQPIFVIGEDDKYTLKEFTSEMVNEFVLEGDTSITDNSSPNRVNTSFEDILKHPCNWAEIKRKIGTAKTFVIEAPQINYTLEAVNLINLFMDSIVNEVLNKNVVLVIYGLMDNINMLKGNCYTVKDIYQNCNKINLTDWEEIDIWNPCDNSDNDDAGDIIKSLLMPKADTAASEPAEIAKNNDAEKELEGMIGLRKVKDDMKDARLMSMFKKKRADMCLQKNKENVNHMLFLGNPGTGKTTVAKLVGQIYHNMGLLSKGHTVETNRAKLVGEYIGMTEKITLEVIEQARGGVLFIDEAYTLISNKESDSKDFGKEAVNALLTVLSEPDPDMIIIMAGYEDKMNNMLSTNPGLKDRFPLNFTFENYNEDELMEIACNLLEKDNYKLTDAARDRLHLLMEKAVANRDEHFGNGRWVHNLINQGVIKSMAKRVMLGGFTEQNKESLTQIEEADIIEAEKNYIDIRNKRIVSIRPIGFRA